MIGFLWLVGFVVAGLLGRSYAKFAIAQYKKDHPNQKFFS